MVIFTFYLAFDPENLIRLFTITSLCGLLFTVGLRLHLRDVIDSIKKCNLKQILVLNYIVVPLIVWILTRSLHTSFDNSVGMLLLASAPFAPVVPIFVKMSKGDLPLAAGLTGIFPVFSTLFSPLVCHFSMIGLEHENNFWFNPIRVFSILFLTNSLPILVGMVVQSILPKLSIRILRPLEMISETIGLASLIFVISVQFQKILDIPWEVLITMILSSELAFYCGYQLKVHNFASRKAIAFGTANRNIALAMLIGIEAFPNTSVLASVVANGLLLILLGLMHVAYYRCRLSFLC